MTGTPRPCAEAAGPPTAKHNDADEVNSYSPTAQDKPLALTALYESSLDTAKAGQGSFLHAADREHSTLSPSAAPTFSRTCASSFWQQPQPAGDSLWRAPSPARCSSSRLRGAGCSGPRRLQGWGLHHLSRQPLPGFNHPQGQSVALSHSVSRISLRASCLVLSLGVQLRRVCLPLLYSPGGIDTCCGDPPEPHPLQGVPPQISQTLLTQQTL